MANGSDGGNDPLDFGDPGAPDGGGALGTEELKQALLATDRQALVEAYASADQDLADLAAGRMLGPNGEALRPGVLTRIEVGKDNDGNPVYQDVDLYNAALNNLSGGLDVLGTSLNARGFDVEGNPLPGGVNDPMASVAYGNLDARLRELQETRRSNQVNEGFLRDQQKLREEQFERDKVEFEQLRADKLKQQEIENAERQRETNISGTLGLLSQEIRRGDLSRQEAADRFAAASESASLQLRAAEDFSGKHLKAGSEYYPNLGPDGAVAGVAKHFGLPFEGFATGGTFGLNPSQTAQGIQVAQQNNAVAGVDAAMARAAQSLAGLGVPGAA